SLKDVFPTLEQFFHLARDKLCGVKDYDLTNNSQALAFLGQRFAPNVCIGYHHAVKHAKSSVASHLRVCIATTEDQAWFYIAYPSEPLFLSVVAANLLHRTNRSLRKIQPYSWQKWTMELSSHRPERGAGQSPALALG
ncbi:hypothetical protein PAXRUDRAFT_143625, partial [Paxillus rubicundulus Ve08.2h10]